MKQKEFLDTIQQETGLDTELVERLTQSLSEYIRGVLSDGDSLTVQGFGSFEVRFREERLSVHPSTGKRSIIPPKAVPVFRPGVSMKERLRTSLGVLSETVSETKG